MYLLNLWDFSGGDVPTFQRILDSAGFCYLFYFSVRMYRIIGQVSRTSSLYGLLNSKVCFN